MKAGVAALTAGILGGTGVLLFLIAFGTDYWLLATETCGVFEHGNSTLRTREAEMPTEVRKEILTFHHEGFFWRCWFFGKGHPETIWTFCQPSTPQVLHAWLPLPHAHRSRTFPPSFLRHNRSVQRLLDGVHHAGRRRWAGGRAAAGVRRALRQPPVLQSWRRIPPHLGFSFCCPRREEICLYIKSGLGLAGNEDVFLLRPSLKGPKKRC
ncbi:transmembrane protein 182-like isoform X3 [Grus americana]|uniref:transmembrane protein 182-like isoform X3 n=1 Tax=Grus americana TaxID=9117 RepID=UPI0024084688|nr:transmembrane protein 182-like isoform X3 [Grus americana]